MKTALARPIRTMTTLVVLSLLVVATFSLSSRGARIQNSAISPYQAGPVLPGSAFNDLLNGLSAMGR